MNFLKNFNNLIKKTIFKVQNKTNDKFQISVFNELIKKTIFKVQNKTNDKFQISVFNRSIIIFISLLFFYLFYLSIPVLYDKTRVQINIEKQLLKEFKINFSISSNISYRILPAPHFLIKDSKIFKEDGNKLTSLANIKNLKIFISQKNFFDKKKIILKYVKINNANFLLSRDSLKLLKGDSNNKFSDKRIQINKSNIFFKDHLNKTITIIKLSKAFLYLDKKNLLNIFNLKGEVFNIPFSFNYNKKIDYPEKEEINIIFRALKLNIFDTHIKEENNLNNRRSIISFLNSTMKTDYKINDNMIVFNSNNSKIKNIKVNYDGELSTNPFDLNLNISLNNYKLLKILNTKSILNEIIKTELLFNKNISISTSIIANLTPKEKLFQKAEINFNIVNGKINFDKTKLINKKIGSLKLENSNLFFKNSLLILNTDIIIDINDNDKLFSLLQTNKNFRKPIKNILINLNYDFLANQIKFNNFKIDNKEASDELIRIIGGFNDNGSNNWNKSKILLNTLFKAYEG